MTMQTLANIAIGLALVGYILYRQMTWRVVSRSRLWRMPIVLGAIGIVLIGQSKGTHLLTFIDAAAFVVELAISLGVGALMGRLATIRQCSVPARGTEPARSEVRDRRRDRRAGETFRAADGSESVMESRTGWLGLGLWIVLILLRVGIDIAATQLGAVLVTATGVILIMVAANRAMRALVLVQRVDRTAGARSMIEA